MSAAGIGYLPDSFLTFLESEPCVAIAVSGGSDSTALLHLVAAAAKTMASAPRLVALTVDHGLRPESQTEAVAVGRQCARLGVEHRILRWTGDKPATGLQAAARLARHSLLAAAATEAGARTVLTGHTRDDQAETVIMRLRRGGGRGVAGMGSQTLFRNSVWFLRPLLWVRRADLRDYLRSDGIDWSDDPSNENDAFERVRLRHELACSPDGETEMDAALNLVSNAAAYRLRLGVRAAAAIRLHAALDNGGIVVDPQLLDADRDAGVYALRILLATVGGLEHLPDKDRVEALSGKLMEPGRFSLARTVISRKRETIILRREARSRRQAGQRQREDVRLRSPWTDFLPWFDREPATAIAELIGETPPPALPWP